MPFKGNFYTLKMVPKNLIILSRNIISNVNFSPSYNCMLIKFKTNMKNKNSNNWLHPKTGIWFNYFLMITHRAATVNIPKPPPEQTAKAIQRRRELRRRKEAGVSFLCCTFLWSYLCPIKPNNLMRYDNGIIKKNLIKDCMVYTREKKLNYRTPLRMLLSFKF